MLKRQTLSNGYVVDVLPGSEAMIDEIWTRNLYGRHFSIEAGMNVLDIGANQGFFSLLAASKGARVFAYEPLPKTFDILRSNIERNQLGARVTSYNDAIGSVDGRSSIFVPTSGRLIPSGSVTTKRALVDKLVDLVDPLVEESTVSVVTLKTAIDRACCSRVDLIKFDCEGSELDALQSAPPSLLTDVHAVVMETHAMYRERDLYRFLQSLGFSVFAYEKRTGVFQTGYLLAARGTASAARTCPVAILSVPSFAVEGQTVTLDGESSFSAISASSSLTYRWWLDGISLSESVTTPLCSVALSPGAHRVRLEVTENGETDEQVHDLICLKRDYFNQSPEIALSEKNVATRVVPGSHLVLEVSHGIQPGFSVAREICIQVRAVRAEGRVAGTFEFNGQASPLTQEVHDFTVDLTPPGVDLLFSLSAHSSHAFDVCWWPQAPSLHLTPRAGEDTRLGPFGHKALVKHDRRHTYRIARDMLPTAWSPKQGVLGIGVVESTPNLGAIGHVTIAGEVFSLGQQYTEVRFELSEGRGDIDVLLDTLGESRELSLAWWTEG